MKCLFLCLQKKEKILPGVADLGALLSLQPSDLDHICVTRHGSWISEIPPRSYFESAGRKTPAKITTHHATRGRSLLCTCPTGGKTKNLSAAATPATTPPSQFCRQLQDINSLVQRGKKRIHFCLLSYIVSQ